MPKKTWCSKHFNSWRFVCLVFTCTLPHKRLQYFLQVLLGITQHVTRVCTGNIYSVFHTKPLICVTVCCIKSNVLSKLSTEPVSHAFLCYLLSELHSCHPNVKKYQWKSWIQRLNHTGCCHMLHEAPILTTMYHQTTSTRKSAGSVSNSWRCFLPAPSPLRWLKQLWWCVWLWGPSLSASTLLSVV